MEAVGRSAPFKYRSKSTRRKMFSCFCLALAHRELWVVESIFDLVALRKTIKFIQKHCLAFEQMGWCTTVTSECTAAFFGKTGMRDQQICAGVSRILFLFHSSISTTVTYDSCTASWTGHLVRVAKLMQTIQSPSLFSNGPTEKAVLVPAGLILWVLFLFYKWWD